MHKLAWFAAKLRLLPWLVLGAICVGALLFMSYSSAKEAAITDELAHIPAGYGYVRYLDFRLNPEHPPLLKALSALPLLYLHPRFPTNAPAWQTAVNGQWDMGSIFLYGSGNDADEIIRYARVFPMLLTLGLILMTYIAGRKILGRFWALLPAVFTGLSPTVLAHGHYVTTDIAAAFGILLAAHFFLKALDAPTKWNIFWSAAAFGIAQLLKFSAVLIIPFFIFLAIVKMWNRQEFWSSFKTLALTGILGMILFVYPVYAVLTWNYPVDKQVVDSAAILTSFAGGPAAGTCNPVRCLAELTIKMAGNKITRPFAEYMLGVLMVMQRADGGNTAYFMGRVSAAGSHWYFPAVYILKESLPALIFVLFAAIAGLWRWLQSWQKSSPPLRGRIDARFTEFAWLTFVVLYWAWSIQSPLNIGFRHVLPTLPFMYLLATSWWKRYVTSFPEFRGAIFNSLGRAFGAAFKMSAKLGLVLALVLWAFIETAVVAPYFLSYFNQLAGGTKGGYRYVTDSNYDWGQDLLRLKAWSDAHPGERIAVDYFGGGNPSYYLGDRAVGWWSAKDSPAAQGIRWFAISVGNLQNSIQPTTPGFNRKPEDAYPWLTAGRTFESWDVPKPDERLGTSIFLYRL